MFILAIVLPYVHTNVNTIAGMNIFKPCSCDHTKYNHNSAAISTEGFQHGLPMTGYLVVFHSGGISNRYTGMNFFCHTSCTKWIEFVVMYVKSFFFFLHWCCSHVSSSNWCGTMRRFSNSVKVHNVYIGWNNCHVCYCIFLHLLQVSIYLPQWRVRFM